MLGSEPVGAGDIAVLVRTGAEGKLVQQELARLAIASVYLSNRERAGPGRGAGDPADPSRLSEPER